MYTPYYIITYWCFLTQFSKEFHAYQAECGYQSNNIIKDTVPPNKIIVLGRYLAHSAIRSICY